jgi:class 3 adenylate cyclase/tetratricopeptide (TPR) repeat protein
LACSSCGQENPEGARFCNACAAPLAPPAPERRKLATLLFCDMGGSTALGERVDAESVRELMFEYFHVMRGAIERHGGTVEKFVGDAVMAVFGVPHAHEDDALRAVRAAAEMQERLGRLNEELERRFGSRIALRIGLNTGEVVAGDASSRETIVTGDAVNVAARLEQAAAPGEVLLGEETYRLVRAAVLAQPVEPIAAKGKSEPVRAYRLVSVVPGPAPARRLEAALVGRTAELAALERHFEQAVAERHCLLATVVGEPGVGKSRLAAELVSRLAGRARVLSGRCLSYGEGITYWPLAEIVKEAAGIRDEDSPARARERIRALSEPALADQVASGLGLGGEAAGAAEIAFAFRRLFESLASERPLLLLIEDLHWAEETLLELLGQLAERAQAPILLLCTARPELLEQHPEWPVWVRLAALSEQEASRLVDGLAAVPEELKSRVLRSAGGNPLFLEELMAFLREEPHTTEIPPSLNVLLAARLDRLPEPERSAAERGAVEGEVFHRGAVVELSPAEECRHVSPSLDGLVERELIYAARAEFVDEAAYRFKHILVRDAAYNGTAKKLRAELHERFAGWLERKAGERVTEYEEILGYHLEQAYRYRAELGPVGEDARLLAGRAAERLGSAGRRALARGDIRASLTLLERALALLVPDEPRRLESLLDRLELLLDLATALTEVGELSRADSILGETVGAARAVGDERLEWRARLGRASAQLWMGGGAEQAAAVAEQAVEAFARLGDDVGLARTWNLVALTRFWLGTTAAAEEAWRHAIEHARRAESLREEAQALSWLLIGTWMGPTPVEDGVRRCQEILERSPTRQVEAVALLEQGPLLAMCGRFSEARELFHRGKELLEDLGLAILAAGASQERFDIEMLAGDPEVAEVELRRACEILEQLGEKGFLSTRAAFLAHALCAQGRYEEAGPFIEVAAETGSEDDQTTQALWRSARAKVLARQGAVGEDLRLAREAVAIVAQTDWLNLRGDALLDLAEVLDLAGRPDDAAPVIAEALRLYEQKGNIVSAGKAHELLAELREKTLSAP